MTWKLTQKQNRSGGDKKSEVAKSVSVNSSKPISPVDTRKELARAVGLGEQTIGRVLQIDEHCPNVVKSFFTYLCRGNHPIFFRWAGKPYSITILNAVLFPQGYAAALTQPDLLREPSVILADIGGWTVDLMRLDNRLPDVSTCRSLELGVIRCVEQTQEQVRRKLGLSVTSAQIESVLRGDPNGMDEDAKQVIQAEADQYVHSLLSAIAETGLDIHAMPIIFMGGGAGLLKRRLTGVSAPCQPFLLDDVSLNAKAFEQLAAQLAERSHG